MKYVKVRIPEERIKKWLEALNLAEEYAKLAKRKLGKVTIVLHGSFARGDFNIWSDIDLIIVSERFRGARLLDRYNILPQQLPGIEPIPLTPDELEEAVAKPAWRHALARGAVIIVDDYNLSSLLERASSKRITSITQLRRRVEELKSSSHESQRDNSSKHTTYSSL